MNDLFAAANSTPPPSDISDAPERPKGYNNLSFVLSSLYPDFKADPEEQGTVIAKSDRESYERGQIPDKYAHHAPELNEARVQFYKRSLAVKEWKEKYGKGSETVKRPVRKLGVMEKNKACLESHRKNLLKIGENIQGTCKRFRAVNSPQDMTELLESVQKDVRQLELTVSSAKYFWS